MKHNSVFLSNDNLTQSEITAYSRILYTPSGFAKESLWYIQEIGKLRSLKGHLSKKDALSSFLYLVVLSGSGIFYYDKKYHLTAGQQLFINCSTPYSHESNDHDPWELMWIHFNGKGVKAYYNYYIEKNEGILMPCHNILPITNNIDQLMTYASNHSNDTELLISNGLNSFITNLIVTERINNEVGTDSDDKILEIKEYIDCHYADKITLDAISDMFYISKFHMSREFKRLFGTSIINYQINCRITKAKELLRFSNLRIEEIAGQCGISDISYFNKVFHKAEGMTGSEFRKKWRGVETKDMNQSFVH